MAEAEGGRARYVAIITDGNGRWAQRRGLPVMAGHEAGADTVKARLRDAARLGIEELTVYSFSTENWNRSAEAITGCPLPCACLLACCSGELAQQRVAPHF